MPRNKTTAAVTPPRRVLIVRFSALGDVAMAVPVVYGVCRANPSTEFNLLTKAPVASLWVNPPANLTVVGADLRNAYKGLPGVVRLFRELYARYRFDAMADLHQVIRTRVMALLCRLRSIRVATIRKGRREKAALCSNHSLSSSLSPLPTSAERYEQVFATLGLATDTRSGSILGPEASSPAVFADITPAKAPGEKWVGIAPFAAHATKIYPTERMEEVVSELSARRGVKVFLFGGGERERAILGSWAARYPGVISLAQRRHGFAKELALMASLDCMVAMDSGNMHLASIAGAPVISIWGATHPAMGFTPAGFNPQNALQADIPCRPCSVFGEKPCRRGDMACMASISPRQIIDKIDSFLNGR